MKKIVLVDDHILLRNGLAGIIAGFDNFNVLFEANNGKHFIEQLDPNNLPDIVLLDVTMPVMSFQPNGYGLYNMAGNVEEFMREKGKTHGGSWRDTGFYLLNDVFENYDTLNSTSAQRGFRFVMEFEK